jgi:phage/plasmid-like protein (TIGR03299 family)
MTTATQPQQQPTYKSSIEALEASKLNWIAEEHELTTRSLIDVASHKALVRSDTKGVLSVVSSTYHPIQNNDAFAFFDTIVRERNARYLKAECFDGGKKISIAAVFGEVNIQPKHARGDIIRNRVSLINSFDGSCSFKVRLTPLRLVCLNGMVASAGEMEVTTGIRHTKNAGNKYEQALQVFNSSQDAFKHFVETSKVLAQKMLDRDKVINLIRETFRIPNETKNDDIATVTKNKMNEVYTLFQKGKGNEGKTAWDFINGVNEWVDHHSRRNDEQRREYSTFGGGFALKERALELVTAGLR